MDWRHEYQIKTISAARAVSCVKSNDRVYVGTASSVAYILTEALYERKSELENVTILSGFIPRPMRIHKNDVRGHFNFLSYFLGAAERTALKAGNNVDYTSFHLSQIDIWCHSIARPNVAFLEVSPPDNDGYMSFGAYGVAINPFIIDTAERIVLQVNRNVPRVFGLNSNIHISQATYVVDADDTVGEIGQLDSSEVLQAISDRIVHEIPDGAVIQLGLGGISGAVGHSLVIKSDLGIHSEMLTDSMIYLCKKGVVNNSRKQLHKGKSVVAFALGTRELYDYIDGNSNFYFAPFTYVNNPTVIAQNDNVMSVNTAMAIDLYGQAAADNIHCKQQSAVGGQLDFVRGAQLSKGGKSFIAITSTTTDKAGKAISRIVPAMAAGTAITTPRSDVQYVVTEFGCVNLKVLSARQRAEAMISLAHTDFRPQLREEAKKLGLL